MRKFLLIGFVVGFLHAALSSRKVSTPVLNPACPNYEIDCSNFNLTDRSNSANNLIYAFSDSVEDRVHVLISTIDGLSVLFVKADLNSSLSVDWSEFLYRNYSQPSIRVFGGPIKNQFGFSLSRLYRYEDTLDLVDLEKSKKVEGVDFSSILWSNVSLNEKTKVVTFRTSNETSNWDVLGLDGVLELSFQIFEVEGYLNLMPRLLHGDQSAQLEINLRGLSAFSYSRVRYALELEVFSTDNHAPENSTNEIRLKDVITMNDENTPGIFETLILQDPLDDAYLLWKPVCYYSSDRGLTSLSRVYEGPLKIHENHYDIGGLMAAYYGRDLSDQKIQKFNISFGLSGDKFYPGFLTWTVQIGLGKPPSEGFSSLIVTLFIACLVTPCGALVTGGWYWFHNKKRRDDFLLAEQDSM